MIPITDLSWQTLSWQEQLSLSIRSLADLGQALNLTFDDVDTTFPINVPLSYLSRIESGNRQDPLLLQVLARPEETVTSGSVSPLAEESFDRGFGVIQKYQGRILVITTGACAINCRYCFRRHFPYDQHQPSSEDWSQIFSMVREDTSLNEVILSGGDPLMLNDRRLAWIMAELNGINHVSSIRLHTRIPMVLPRRVTQELLTTFQASRAAVVLVTHINHANEIDEQVISACQALTTTGATLLNQSVLLRGINDGVEPLKLLALKLQNAGILPYYLHLMDPVQGADHFDVSEAEGVAFISQLRNQLPGYLVPRLVREIPHKGAKTLIA